MDKIQYGEVLMADLHENTITFEMNDSFAICSGEFAIIKLENLQEKIALEEFIENLNS